MPTPTRRRSGGLNDEEWAAEIGVPTLRSLIGGEPRTEVRFDDGYLGTGVGEGGVACRATTW